jgi:hypothetical protein
MKRLSILITILITLMIAVLAFVQTAQSISWNDIKKKGEDVYREQSGSKAGLTNDEVIRGLKQALEIGSNNAASIASKIDGFYKNPRIMIPFPPEAKKVKTVAETLGMKEQVRKFEETLNRAAEEAAKEAAPIFINAIKQMTIQDGFKILSGPDDAATAYLRNKTTSPLKVKFRPVVKRAIEKVQVTKYWNPIVTKYNQVPFVTKVNPDLDEYVTDKGLQGLFYLIAQEEKKIRKNPAARVTELLRRVFG